MTTPIFAHKVKITNTWTEGADVLATFKRFGFVPPSEVVTPPNTDKKEVETSTTKK